MLLCVLPFAVWFLVARASIGAAWLVIGAVVLMVIGHFWLMRRGHKHDEEPRDEINAEK